MKKTAIAIAVALAGFATVAQAAPKDNTWYTGAKLGWSQYHDTGFINNNGPTHENQLGAGAFGGYQVNPYVGFEMGYDWLGRMPYKGSVELGYPITDDLDIYTRLGGMVWRADTKSNVYGKNHDTGVSPVFAGGVEYAITPEIATRLEYQWTNNIGDAHTIGTRPDNGMLRLGVSYRFVLFNFNKATLKPEGQAALDQLYSQLSNLDPKDGSVVVLGYTDRIGSDAYNQGLSERRAQSVVDYLISKGIPADKISARGMGESNPVTGNTCDNVKQRAALIDCLAPDRRVEIEVKGIKDVVTQPQA